MADAAVGAEQVDGFEDVVEVVRRLAHAHEHHFLHRSPAARQDHLGDHLQTADLAQQAAAAGHAEHTADRAADLGRDAQPTARQQHAFHHLPVGQFHQQARRAVARRMLAVQAGDAFQFRGYLGQTMAHAQRQEVLGPLAGGAGIEGAAL